MSRWTVPDRRDALPTWDRLPASPERAEPMPSGEDVAEFALFDQTGGTPGGTPVLPPQSTEHLPDCVGAGNLFGKFCTCSNQRLDCCRVVARPTIPPVLRTMDRPA